MPFDACVFFDMSSADVSVSFPFLVFFDFNKAITWEGISGKI